MRARRYAVAGILLTAGLIGGGFLLATAPGGSGLFGIATPLWELRAWFGERGGEIAALVQRKQSLARQRDALQRQVAELQARVRIQEPLVEEHARLAALLGRTDEPQEGILARVLVRPPETLYDTLIVDRGSDDGVAAGDVVSAYGTVPLGVVDSVHGGSAKVALFSSPGRELSVLIGAEALQAHAQGLGGGTFRAELPRGAGVREGDEVRLSTANGAVFAFVESVTADAANPFQEIYFTNPVNISELVWVHVQPE